MRRLDCELNFEALDFLSGSPSLIQYQQSIYIMYIARLSFFHSFCHGTPENTHVHLVHRQKPMVSEVRLTTGFRCQMILSGLKKFVSNFINCIALKMLVHHTALTTSPSEVSSRFLLQWSLDCVCNFIYQLN